MEPVSTEQRARHPLDPLLARVYTLNWEAIAYVVIFVLAVLTRMVDLGTRVMSHDESLHVKFAYDLYQNGIFSHTPLMHGPLLFHMTAFFYLLFGDNDFTGRLYAALVGIVVVMMPILFRRWLGKTGALLASILFLISPLLMYYSRYVRHDLPVILFALIMLYAIFQYVDGPEGVRRKPRWLILLAAAMSLMLASKEVAFIYIAIFGSFLTLFWLIRLGQQYLRWRNGQTLLGLFSAGIILGIVAALVLICILWIVPPQDYDADGVPNATDNCINVANGNQVDDNVDGIGNDCALDPGPNLAGRLVTWIVGIVAILGVTLLGTALWARRSGALGFPWREVLLIVLLGVLTCVIFVGLEGVTHVNPQLATPTDPSATNGAVTAITNNLPIVLAWVVGAVIVGLAILARALGFWEELKRFPVFDVLILMGTLILPWLTAFLIASTGAKPTDYSTAGIARAVLALIPFAAVAITVGLVWNWRVWLVATGVFMAIFAFFFTTMFTNGQGLASGMIGSLGYWIEQQGERRGNQPQYYYVLLMVPFYEFLPLIGASLAGVFGLRRLWNHIYGQRALAAEAAAIEAANGPLGDGGEVLVAEAVVAEAVVIEDGVVVETVVVAEPDAIEAAVQEAGERVRSRGTDWLERVPFMTFVGYWAVVNLIAYTFAGEKMPWLTTHLTVPLGLAAAWFGGQVIDGLSWEKFRAARLEAAGLDPAVPGGAGPDHPAAAGGARPLPGPDPVQSGADQCLAGRAGGRRGGAVRHRAPDPADPLEPVLAAGGDQCRNSAGAGYDAFGADGVLHQLRPADRIPGLRPRGSGSPDRDGDADRDQRAHDRRHESAHRLRRSHVLAGKLVLPPVPQCRVLRGQPQRPGVGRCGGGDRGLGSPRPGGAAAGRSLLPLPVHPHVVADAGLLQPDGQADRQRLRLQRQPHFGGAATRPVGDLVVPRLCDLRPGDRRAPSTSRTGPSPTSWTSTSARMSRPRCGIWAWGPRSSTNTTRRWPICGPRARPRWSSAARKARPPASSTTRVTWR